MTAISITVVDHMTTEPEIEGLNLAAAQHKKNKFGGLNRKHSGR